jgi:hypothetical protein
MSSIPQPQKDEQGKIIGDFYPLQRAELVALRKNKLINNAAYVHLALRYENPYCDRPIELYPKEFAMRWQMPESSVYEAIAKLKETNVVNIKSGKVVLEWTHSQEDTVIDSQEDGVSGNPESLRKPRKNSGFSETVLDCQKKFQDSRKKSGIPENQPPEPAPSKDSTTSHTIQTYSDFIQTLSEEARENFEKFCKRKIEELPKKPTLPQKWVEENLRYLKPQFEEEEGRRKAVEEQLKASKAQPPLTTPKTTANEPEIIKDVVPTAEQLNQGWLEAKRRGNKKMRLAIEDRARLLGYVVTKEEIFDPEHNSSSGQSSGVGFKKRE